MSQPSIRDYFRAAAIGGDASDAVLLERFAAARDEAAFELLVWRHATLVQRVCRAVLHDHHAAEDAAQAAFLVLARKAHTFAGRGSVVGWLYRVARRVSLRLAKQRSRLPLCAELDRVPAIVAESVAADEAAMLWNEVAALPERYRVPVLLCFFEGLTHAEAARRTGWPVGTVAGRLSRAKELLARRLTRKGVGLAAVGLGVPAGNFVGSTAHAAPVFAARGKVVPGVESSVLSLAEGACFTMTATVSKCAAIAAALFVATATVWGLSQSGSASAPSPKQAAAPQPAAGERIADAKQRARSINNIKQLLLAIHNYHDAHGNIPHDITNKAGTPLLSWRILLLPYIEQDALYKQFKLDEPWDSDHNKKLLTKMPPLFLAGVEPPGETKTYYQGYAGKGTIFETGRILKITDIPDGTSNTIGVVEAGPAVEWTKPGDLPFDPEKPLPKRAGPFSNVLMAGLMDGSVMMLRPDIDDKILRLLINRDDGTPIPDLREFRPKFELTADERKQAQEILEKNEKLASQVAEQLREQQKLLGQLGAKVDVPIKGLDIERLNQMQRDLEQTLEQIRKETDELRKTMKVPMKK